MAKYRSKLPLLIAKENLRRVEQGKKPLSVQEIADGAGISRQTIHRWRQDRLLESVSHEAVVGLMQFFRLRNEFDLYDTIVDDSEEAAQSRRPPLHMATDSLHAV